MAFVDVERVYIVFHLFAVTPSGGAAREPYIPSYFLAVATREVGLYPTTSSVHQFIKSVPTASAGEVTFAAFLQFCEDVAYTSRLGRSDVYKLVDDLDTRGSGLISRQELFLILTNGSADISAGEIDAVMEMLDPTMRGYVVLKDLATLLIEQCQQRRSQSRASPPGSRHVATAQPGTSSIVSVAGQQRQLEQHPERRRHQDQHQHQHRDYTPHSNPPQYLPDVASQPVQRKEPHPLEVRATATAGSLPRRRVRRFVVGSSLSSKERATPVAPVPQPSHHPASSNADAAAESESLGGVECDCSFKRTDIPSSGEVAYCKCGSLYNRGDTFERTQTAMTVDVDGPLSVSATPMRQPKSVTVAAAAATASRHTPLRRPQPLGSPSPLPKGLASRPSSGSLPFGIAAVAAATAGGACASPPADEPRQKSGVPAKTEEKEKRNGKEGEASPQAPLTPSAPQDEGDDEISYYSKADRETTVVRSGREKQLHAETPMVSLHSLAEATTPTAPSNPPKAKEAKTKCCTIS